MKRMKSFENLATRGIGRSADVYQSGEKVREEKSRGIAYIALDGGGRGQTRRCIQESVGSCVETQKAVGDDSARIDERNRQKEHVQTDRKKRVCGIRQLRALGRGISRDSERYC